MSNHLLFAIGGNIFSINESILTNISEHSFMLLTQKSFGTLYTPDLDVPSFCNLICYFSDKNYDLPHKYDDALRRYGGSPPLRVLEKLTFTASIFCLIMCGCMLVSPSKSTN